MRKTALGIGASSSGDAFCIFGYWIKEGPLCRWACEGSFYSEEKVRVGVIPALSQGVFEIPAVSSVKALSRIRSKARRILPDSEVSGGTRYIHRSAGIANTAQANLRYGGRFRVILLIPKDPAQALLLPWKPPCTGSSRISISRFQEMAIKSPFDTLK